MVIYTIYPGDPSIHYLLQGDITPRRFSGWRSGAEHAFTLHYPDAKYLDPNMFEDVVYTRRLHENARLTKLRRLQRKEQAS